MTDLRSLAEVQRANRLIMLGTGAVLVALVALVWLFLPKLVGRAAAVALGGFLETVAFLKLRGAWRYPRIMSQREAVDDLEHGLTFAAAGALLLVLALI